MSSPDIIERFRRRAEEDPGAPLYTFVDDAGRDEETLCMGDTARQAEAIAGFLRRACGLSAGDRVLLVYPPSLDFVKAFVGCLFAGVVPVPLPPPDPLRMAADLSRFAALAESSGARAVLTNTRYAMARTLGTVKNVLSRPWRRWPDLPWHTTDRCKPGAYEAPPRRAAAPGDTAFLQYTSGSTSQPKGVMITYGNLEHQLAANARELGFGPRSRMVAWIPHFHDFGLISGILSALHGNGQFIMMSPLTFIKRPELWFEVISRARATHTAAPTFGYELAVRKTTARQRERWDLSSLEIAMCAAEPIHPETVRRFLSAFAVSGLRPSAFCPAYGLAEHTVGVSTRGRGVLRASRPALEREGRALPAGQGEDAKVLVACGAPSEGVRVRIVDPSSGAALPDGRVGEIWVDSPSKAAGYHGLPEETARTFRARIEGDATEYLRTGDLGLLHEGQIYVTGRLKDVIIIRGKNLYPQDIEDTIRDGHPLIRPGGVAAFSIEERAEERLAIVVEVRDGKIAPAQAREVAQAIRRLVLDEHQQACHTVVLAPPGAVPKTTSGKVMRRACRDALSSGELARAALHVDRAASGDPTPTPPQGGARNGGDRRAERSGGAPGGAPEARDPRLTGLDEDYARLVGELGATFRRITAARKGRVFHKEATTLQGELRVLDAPAIPRHRFFASGARYGVIVRHANGVQDDDAGWDNRGATVRVLAAGSGDLERPLLDLLLTTGACFLAGSARDFHRWMTAGRAAREAIVRESPHVGAAAWEMFRSPSSYTRLHYHSKIASHFRAEDGARWFVRYRLVPPDRAEDTGFVDPGGAPIPPEVVPRRADDRRSPTFLHEDLRARLAAGNVSYLLQVQLRPVSASGDEDEAALDCTRPWTEAWRDVALLTLDARADEARVDALRFDPFHAPPELALPLARSADERASLGHLRSLVYEIAARARLGQPLPPGLAELAGERAPAPRQRVCVVGGGAAGLAAAWALERQGLEVTVLERGASVAGKCASLEVDGRSYDWGGHLCTAHYTSLATMADALGAEKEPATPTLVYDIEQRSVRPREESPRLREEFLRYQGLRERAFPDITRPGLHRVAPALARPVAAWLEAEGLRSLGAAVGVNYTSCGYGFLDDEELAALYVVKGAEMGGILSTGKASGLPEAWTVAGGFGAFWQRVAAGLADVRCGASPTAIERRASGVVVHTKDARLEFDHVIIASPLDEALSFLDATAEERELFSRIRYVDYHTIACRAQGLPRKGFYLVKQHCEGRLRAGHAVAFHHRYDDSDVYLFYAYGGPGLDLAALEARLGEDVARMGGELHAVIDHRRWKYFPHASSRDLEQGYQERLEALQGQHRTFYLGSIFNFELIECNVAYAHDLVARFFGDGARRAPEPREAAGSGGEGALTSALAGAGSAAARAVILGDYLQRLFAEELRLPALPPPESRFLDLGLDSVRAVEVFQRLAVDTGGRTLAPVIFFDHPTIAELAAHLADELAGLRRPHPNPSPRRGSERRRAESSEEPGIPGAHPSPRRGSERRRAESSEEPGIPGARRAVTTEAHAARGPWLRAVRPVEHPEQRLFCFHHAGGSSAVFDGWALLLPDGIEILAVELPGRGARAGEPPCTELDTVLAALEEAISPLCDRPVALFGHSLGAGIAFELCRRLRRRGATLPAHLFVSGFVPPRDHDPSRALTARDIGPAFALGGPALEADFQLFRSWSYAPEDPLDVPITALGGAADPLAPPALLEGWRAETRAAFEHATFPGHHFYFLSDPAPLLERLSRDLTRGGAEARVRSFAAAWRARPHALGGAWNLFDLCWLARIAGPGAAQPAFPEALAALLLQESSDGGLGTPSPHPYCNLVTALAFANTLLRWNTDDRHGPAIERALARALGEHALANLRRPHPNPSPGRGSERRRAESGEEPGIPGAQGPLASGTGEPYGRFFRFHGFFGRWLVPARECREILERGDRYLTSEQRSMALSYAAAHDVGFTEGGRAEVDYDRFFDQDSLVLHFAEYFPDEAFRSAAARAHAERVSNLPGLTAAAAARYYEVTGDAGARARILSALERPLDGLRPGGRLQELHFALAYLLGGGVDVRRSFPAEVVELEASAGAEGVGVEPGARLADCDATAVTQLVCHALGLPTRMPTSRLESFWDADRSSYASADGHATYTVSTTMHVLATYLAAPDVTLDERRAVWRRTTALLDARPWVELHHLSPFYVWEKIASILGAHEHLFPETPTRAHRDALAQILARQDESGGFCGVHVEEPNQEETALALLALRSALAWPRGCEARPEIEDAARRARAFLERERRRASRHPDLWVGKLLYAPVNLIEAIVTAALAR